MGCSPIEKNEILDGEENVIIEEYYQRQLSSESFGSRYGHGNVAHSQITSKITDVTPVLPLVNLI